VTEQKRTDDQLIDEILKTISKYNYEVDSVRKIVYFAQLLDQLKTWAKEMLNYKSKEEEKDEEIPKFTDEMGIEIFGVARRIINKEKVQQSKTGFVKYLNKSLKNAKAEYYRKFDSSVIKIPKELSKLETQDDILKMKERQFGRKLTEKERLKYKQIWNKIENLKYTSELSYDIEDKTNSSFTDCLINEKTEKMVEAIKYVFEKIQDRCRACYLALYTIYCIRKKKYFKALDPALDPEILDVWQKEGYLPKQSEIYLKYYNVSEKSAEARSSSIINDLNKKIKAYLVKQYPKLFP